MLRSKRLAGTDRSGPPSRVLLTVGVLLGAYLTVRLPIMTVVLVIAAVDVGILFYWFFGRAGRQMPVGRQVARAPIRRLAEVLRVAGVLLIAGALWLTILGFLTEFGITNESAAHWNELAAIGFQVKADQPAAFGGRCIAVAVAVWAVGFGLTKASGEKG